MKSHLQIGVDNQISAKKYDENQHSNNKKKVVENTPWNQQEALKERRK